MKDVTFGQYYPSNSVIHRMNASVKLLLSIAYMVAIFLVSQNNWYFGFALCALFVVFSTIIAKIPFFKMLKSIKAILFFVILSALLQTLFNKQGTPLWENGFITDQGLIAGAFIALRIILIVTGFSILTFTTSPVEIADGLEYLLIPLKLFKLRTQDFALIVSIALRFIPTLMEETDRIIKAQQARGADFEGGLFKRAKALIPILLPLIISSFRRADELADAMDTRCYSNGKRTKYKKFTLSWGDLFSTIFVAGVIAGVVFLNGVVIL